MPASGFTNVRHVLWYSNRWQVIVACSALTAPSRAHPFKAKGVRVVRPDRVDEFSLKSQQKLFNDFAGKKTEYLSNQR